MGAMMVMMVAVLLLMPGHMGHGDGRHEAEPTSQPVPHGEHGATAARDAGSREGASADER